MTTPTLKKAYCYIRFSTPEQSRGDSLMRQLEASEAYARDHGLELDTTLRDLGVSAFTGTNVTEGALAGFLAAIAEKQVAPGSVLIVENLDRISRQHVATALTRFLGILNAGIAIVTTSDRKKYEGKLGVSDLIASLLSMDNAHSESLKKSERVGAAWARKKRNAGDGTVLTRIVPGWIKVIGNGKSRQMAVVPEYEKIVKQMFKLAKEGCGQALIARKLNKAGVLRFDGLPGWHGSTVAKILDGRAVLGEYQPHTRVTRTKRKPDGDAITNYYPTIIDNETFLAVRAARIGRRRKGGRLGQNVSNLFTHLAVCEHCGGTATYKNRTDRSGHRGYLVCHNARRGLDCTHRGWRYEQIEQIILRWILDFDFTRSRPTAALAEISDKIAVKEGELYAIRHKIEQVTAAIEADGSIQLLVPRLKQHAVDEANIHCALTKLQSEFSNFKETQQSIDDGMSKFIRLIQEANKVENRIRLRTEIRARVAKISIIFDAKRNGHPSRFAYVTLKNGDIYTISEDFEASLSKEGQIYELNDDFYPSDAA